MIRRILNRIADWLTADARAEHGQVGRPDIVFRPRKGDVRDTAADMLPSEREDLE